MRTRWGSAAVLALGLVLAACSSGGNDNDGGSGGTGGSGDVQLTIKDFSFDPEHDPGVGWRDAHDRRLERGLDGAQLHAR